MASKKVVKKKTKKNQKVRNEVNGDEQFQQISNPEDDRLLTFTRSGRKKQKEIEAATSERQQNEETNEYEPDHEEINKNQEGDENEREEKDEENEKMDDVQTGEDPIEPHMGNNSDKNHLKNGDFEEGSYVFPNTSWGVLILPNIEDDYSPLPGWMVESLKAVKYVDSDHFSLPEEKRGVEHVTGKESAIAQIARTIDGKQNTQFRSRRCKQCM
ncbi:hypothetical protein GIB67_025348 [Kingdonia uniflora]|uniref:Uncharacterized protein n=1 Tax=Kingdonia uniflora TaxID=39325 RepID=A0A7J7NC24_9MAGN|nr:hypothetical protein GIB67_025348 [Kingdonia uniflora]